MDLKTINQSLSTKWWARELLVLPATGSTNDDCKSRGKAGAPQGFTLIADTQTEGRGRYGRKWFSPAGSNIYFSTVLRPNRKLYEIPTVTLTAAVAIHDCLTQFLPKELLGIKWPNDILGNGKKLAGILTELFQEPPFLVLGVGLNVNVEEFPEELQSIATSVKILLDGKETSREELFAKLCFNLEKWYELWTAEGFAPIRDYWEKNSGMVGRTVKITGKENVTGMVKGISETGGLLVEDQAGEIREEKGGEIELLSR
ncbi:biotin--[acetyl-CoA-carboxylase] ligase [Bdellovibrionota bacterium]